MTTGMIHDQSLEKHMEKQMGCFTGFRQIFDRHQLLTGKRLYTTKRLPAPSSGSISPETEKSDKSLKEPEKPSPRAMTSPSPDRYKSPELRSPAPAPAQTPPRSSLPHPIFELNEATKYSWKFSKETPRLSLDSRATFDSTKGSLRTNTHKSEDNARRSTSVIARLMGLESTPPEPVMKPAELTRSASESRVSREMNNNFQPNHIIRSNVIREKIPDPIKKPLNSTSESRGFKSPQQRRNFFDSADIFPEPKQTTVSIYGQIERRMKLKGIDEQSQDLETLKQILEAMQLKGLLHSKKAPSQVKNKNNVVYERNYSFPCDDDEQHSVVSSVNRRVGSNSPTSSHRSKTEYRRSDSIPAVSPRRERISVDRNMRSPTRGRNVSSPTRNEMNVKNSNVRRNQLMSERRVIESPEHRRLSPINSPRITPRRNVSDQMAANRSPRNRKSATQIYPKGKISTTFVLEDESSYSSTISETDTERCKSEDYKEGKSLLERCDKLLHSIAEMNATESQPSPISVLDSSFYKDESLSPSPVMKRTISFTDESVELDEEELGSPGLSSINSKFEDEIDDGDYIYVSRILRASSYLTEDDDIFLFVEKQYYFNGKDYTKEARLHRKLIFDIATEIIDRNKQLSPWKAFSTKNSNISKPLPRQIWSELQRIQEPNDHQSTDLFAIVCGVLKKDLAGDGWGDLSVEMSEAVLDIERLIFKDLIGESIRDLAEFAGNSRFLAPRRKLVF